MGHPSIGGEAFKPAISLDPALLPPGFVSLNPQLFQSTISPSQQESGTTAISSDSPRLQNSLVFSLTIDSAVAYASMTAKFNEAATIFLNGWNKSLQEQAELVREYLKSPAYLDKLQSHSTTTLAKEESKAPVVDKIAIKGPTQLEAFVSSVPIEVALNYLNLNSYATSPGVGALVHEASKIHNVNNSTIAPAAPSSLDVVNPTAAKDSTKTVEIGPEHFMAASLIIGAGVAAASVDPTSTGLHTEAKVIQDAYSAVLPLQDQSAQAVLMAGWFSSMWGTALLTQTSAENLTKYKSTEGGNTKKINVDVAKSYAANLIDNLKSPAFNRLMVEMVLKTQEHLPVDKQVDTHKLILQSKVVLLSTALALVAKLDVAGGNNEGWFNELDFEGLLNGTTKLSQNDIHNTQGTKQQLINEINLVLSQMSPAESAAIVQNLKMYFKSLPSAENLLNQQKVLADVMPGILDPKPYDENYLENNTV